MGDGKQDIIWACETLMFVGTRINASSKGVSCIFLDFGSRVRGNSGSIGNRCV